MPIWPKWAWMPAGAVEEAVNSELGAEEAAMPSSLPVKQSLGDQELLEAVDWGQRCHQSVDNLQWPTSQQQ
jgi:hypothetical protein